VPGWCKPFRFRIFYCPGECQQRIINLPYSRYSTVPGWCKPFRFRIFFRAGVMSAFQFQDILPCRGGVSLSVSGYSSVPGWCQSIRFRIFYCPGVVPAKNYKPSVSGMFFCAPFSGCYQQCINLLMCRYGVIIYKILSDLINNIIRILKNHFILES
jgi:hypothetical protein